MLSYLTSPFYLISLLISVGLIVHCIKTGRNTIWVWVMLWLVPIGALVYLAVEILPDLFRSRTSRRAVRGVQRALDPGQDLRRYELEARRSGDVASRQRYADELLRQHRAGEAIEIYRQALSGLYEHDPNLMLGLARAQFALGQPTEARQTLDALIQHNPGYKSPDGHLLYARLLQAEGATGKALEEYKVLAGYYAGAEAKLRYAQLLKQTEQRSQAKQVLQELLEHARAAPRHYRKMQQEWLAQAEKELAGL
ncbi:MAG: tetratricopeptide repeat protein [Steroidobacteraceae bacterium]